MSSSGGSGRRRRGRELALRVLFELEGTDKDAGASLAYQAEEVGATADVQAFAQRLVLACLENRERIDAALSAASRWSLGDVGKVERAILRLGTCELIEGDGLDVDVVDALHPHGVTYTAQREDAVAAVDRGDAEAAFLIRPTRIEDVFERARRGEVMPQKTTYFFPKLTSGLLFHPLD